MLNSHICSESLNFENAKQYLLEYDELSMKSARQLRIKTLTRETVLKIKEGANVDFQSQLSEESCSNK